ncbi:uncharacterized protein E5676_scaffold343G001180 [Cucumis melo var. makuwa]|uniref:Uncharacterized protein n=1 Tax=Cucumis melo var. makuwa TaxID=1194695 RepID=A0A5D3E3S8_CUCMM|nr:uncharacterized protein E5676_scaffold343G001180 [Cucumis melo var. makuwa]
MERNSVNIIHGQVTIGGRSLACPENSDSAGTLYDAVPRSLTISNHNLTTDTDALLLEFPNQPLTTNVYVRNNAKASVPLLWSRVQDHIVHGKLSFDYDGYVGMSSIDNLNVGFQYY